MNIRPDKTVERPVYVDIDGTLTSTPGRPWGPTVDDRVATVRRLVDEGYTIVLWSGGGRTYARRWAAEHGLAGSVACEGKPAVWVDDNPYVSPSMDVVGPDWLDGP